jgi:hypothetical protein
MAGLMPGFHRKATEWRTEQVQVLRNIETHVIANQNYIEEGVSSCNLLGALTSCSSTSRPRKNEDLILYSRTLYGRTPNCRPNTGNPLMCWRLPPRQTNGRDLWSRLVWSKIGTL